MGVLCPPPPPALTLLTSTCLLSTSRSPCSCLSRTSIGICSHKMLPRDIPKYKSTREGHLSKPQRRPSPPGAANRCPLTMGLSSSGLWAATCYLSSFSFSFLKFSFLLPSCSLQPCFSSMFHFIGFPFETSRFGSPETHDYFHLATSGKVCPPRVIDPAQRPFHPPTVNPVCACHLRSPLCSEPG